MAIKKYLGGAWTNIAQIRRHNGTAWVDCSFARKYINGSWQDVWTREKVILERGAWVTGGITGWTIINQNPSYSYATQVPGDYTEIKLQVNYTGGGTWSIPCLPNPLNVTGYTRLRVELGAVNVLYASPTNCFYVGTLKQGLVSDAILDFDITGLNSVSVGVALSSLNSVPKYVRIKRIILS